MDLLIATGNRHKVGEISAILDGLPVAWRTTAEWPNATEVSEPGDTYEVNATIKAVVWSERTGLWTLSDDSGLEVQALGGRPGVRSARYAPYGECPMTKLLGELEGVPDADRAARFVCVACLASPEGKVVKTRGELPGRIAFAKKGAGGFGFDPVFIPDGYGGVHLAELPEAEKNRISHRARALALMRPHLSGLLGL